MITKRISNVEVSAAAVGIVLSVINYAETEAVKKIFCDLKHSALKTGSHFEALD